MTPEDIASPAMDLARPELQSWHLLALLVLGVYGLHFLLQGFAGKWMGRAGGMVAVLFSGAAATLGILLFFQIPEFAAGSGSWGINPILQSYSLPWFEVEGGLAFAAGIFLNKTAATMLALVTFITFLVHLFSLEYMKEDKRKPRYWAFLSLFALSMCGIVLADNLFLIFVFWELVGFSSYLLIGFWFEKEKAARSSQKAFLVNRIGDLGFVIGMLMMVAYGLDLHIGVKADYHALSLTFEEAPHFLIGFFLVLGVIGKSAQFPLQVWLPDAMAGPTPVSSLLHAATMVAAGVYMLLRIEFLYTPELLTLLAVLGAFTALIAAFSAFSQRDIKAVLAYSTISQLGFMVMAVGVGAQDFAFFHLITHAFFKCGLFLVAGAVIHQVHAAQKGQAVHFDAQDLGLMGGLGRKMPFAMGAYVIFAAALAGLPFFSGFLSKDGILLAALGEGEGLLWLVPLAAILASGLTAFYITRHGLLVFAGKTRMEASTFDRIRPANWTMRIPLAVLALFSLWVAYSPANPFHAEAHFGEFKLLQSEGEFEDYGLAPIFFVAIALMGIFAALLAWRRGAFERPGMGLVARLSRSHFFLDDFYTKGISQPLLRFSAALGRFDKQIVDGFVNLAANTVVRENRLYTLSGLSAWFDRNVIDRIVNGLAQSAMALGKRFRKVQGGDLQKYLVYTLLALLALFAALYYFT